jgi:hypothetical protein
MKAYMILRSVLKMDIGETNCFKIKDNRFLFVDNWCDEDGTWCTTLELTDGEEVDGKYDLREILEIVTLDYGNKEDLKDGIKFMLNKCKRRRLSW